MSDTQTELDLIQEEMDSIKERLDLMGVKYHHNAKLETLKTLLDKELKGNEATAEPKSKDAENTAKALELLNCAINCNNPGKRQLKGEFVTVGNSVLGHHTYFVPYNCPEAEEYVLPRMVIDALKERRYLSKTEEMVKDIHERSFYMAPEFTVSILGNA